MEVPFPRLHKVRQIDLHQDIHRQPLSQLSELSDQWDLRFSEHPAPGTITTEYIVLLDVILWLGHIIPHPIQHGSVIQLRMTQKTRTETHAPAVLGSAASDDWLELGLRWINMTARTRTLIVGPPLWIVAPGINPDVLLARHVVAPTRVCHTVAGGRLMATQLFQADVLETFHGDQIRDMSTWRLRGSHDGRNQDAFHGVGWMRGNMPG